MSQSVITEDEIKNKWPLHWLVWVDNHKALDRLLAEKQNDVELVDPRGRTPVHLAVTLVRLECTAVLLKHGASTLANNRHHWSVLNEAVCTGNPELIGMVLQYREQQQKTLSVKNIPLMLEKLQSTPDYYIEMKWEFSSWLPLVSRMCPSDTCKIWKKGTTVRVDTTLIGFQNMRWQRGHQTLVFEATSHGHRICDINHGDKTYWTKEFKLTEQSANPVQTILSHEMGVLHRISSPVVSTHVDTGAIGFQRQKSGIWGFRSDKVEQINGYTAKVFTATGLNINTNTRVEHLPESEKKKQKSVSPLQDFLGAAQNQASNMPAIESAEPVSAEERPPVLGPRLTMEQYFTQPNNTQEPDAIGRPPEVSTRTQKLKATVSLAENFPLDLQEQVMPIIDLMAMNTPHFAKVKDFINLHMPSGFPIKFEIPLFHLMAAKVTFGNLNGASTAAPHVSLCSEQVNAEPAAQYTPAVNTVVTGVKHRHGETRLTDPGSSVDAVSENSPPDVGDPDVRRREICKISEDCFSVPAGYRRLHVGSSYSGADDEEELLQLAIRQSLLEQESGGEELSLKEALTDHNLMGGSAVPVRGGRAFVSAGRQSSGPSDDNEDLEIALALSQQMAEEDERKRLQPVSDFDDDELQRVLKLSLEDK